MTRLVTIGASAGGVPALIQLTAALPADFPAPVLVVLHVGMHEGLLPMLLSRNCALDVAPATDGETLRPGCIRVAPPDHHLLVEDGVMRLSRGAKENYSRPAIDPLFRSAALAHDGAMIGVILTGKLDDGTAGMQAIKQCGGISVVQDPADAVEPSMPSSALQHVEVDHCVPLALMPMLITSLAALPVTPSKAGGQGASMVPLEHELELGQGKGDPLTHLRAIGQPSPFTCPDCHGGLWRILDSRPTRYRCHTGHGFTERSLQHAIASQSDDAVWNALRALQERQMLLEQMARLQEASGDAEPAATYDSAAQRIARQVAVLRGLIERAPDPLD